MRARQGPRSAGYPLNGAIIRYADAPDVPWANGGGSTRLLWSGEAGGRRISVATLAAPAAFSCLPGMARVLRVLDPVRVTLDVAGTVMTLCQHDAIAFDGGACVRVTGIDRPARVLNVMSGVPGERPCVTGCATAAETIGWLAAHDGRYGTVPVRRGDLILDRHPPRDGIVIAFRAAGDAGDDRPVGHCGMYPIV